GLLDDLLRVRCAIAIDLRRAGRLEAGQADLAGQAAAALVDHHQRERAVAAPGGIDRQLPLVGAAGVHAHFAERAALAIIVAIHAEGERARLAATRRLP